MFLHFFCRALADILRQQGLNKENENIAALEGSPKDIDTPLRTSKNHYTPVHTMLANHGGYLHCFYFTYPRISCKNDSNCICPKHRFWNGLYLRYASWCTMSWIKVLSLYKIDTQDDRVTMETEVMLNSKIKWKEVQYKCHENIIEKVLLKPYSLPSVTFSEWWRSSLNFIYTVMIGRNYGGRSIEIS